MMNRKTIPPTILTTLVALGLLVPPCVIVLILVGKLLAAMGDAVGETIVARVAGAGTIVWLVDLVLLVLALGIDSLSSDGDSEDISP